MNLLLVCLVLNCFYYYYLCISLYVTPSVGNFITQATVTDEGLMWLLNLLKEIERSTKHAYLHRTLVDTSRFLISQEQRPALKALNAHMVPM